MKKAPIGAHGRRTERTLTHHHGNHFPSQIRRMTIDRTKSPRAPASLGSQASISPVAHGRSQPRSAPREERVDQGASVLWRNVPQKQPLQRVIQNFYTGIAFTKTPFSFSLSLSLCFGRGHIVSFFCTASTLCSPSQHSETSAT